MSEKKYTTYLLGAGASANSLPVFKTMNNRLLLFYDFLVSGGATGMGSKIMSNELEKCIHKYVLQSIDYGTPDTYAKILRLQRENETYQHFKDFLSLYFTFEQLGYGAINFFENLQPSDDNSTFQAVNRQLDHRYPQFFATLFEEIRPDSLNASPVRIISWNYDLQIEILLSRILKCSIHEACKLVGTAERENSASDFLLRLNGSASFFKENTCLLDKFINTENSFSREDMKDKIREFRNTCIDFLSGSKDGYQNMLAFAWESNKTQSSKEEVFSVKNVSQIANQTVINSRTLIVVGYSFPNFNRHIDREIFRGIDGYRNTINATINDQEAEKLKPLLSDLLHIGNSSVKHHFDTHQFLITNQLLNDLE